MTSLHHTIYKPAAWPAVVCCPSEHMTSDDMLSNKSEVLPMKMNGRQERAVGTQPTVADTKME